MKKTSKTRENEFSAAISADLRRYGALVYPLIAGKHTPDGWPDKLVVHEKFFGLLEIKGETTKLEIAQKQVIGNVRRIYPFSCYIVRKGNSSLQGSGGGWVLDENEAVLAWFNGTGRDLLLKLEGLRVRG